MNASVVLEATPGARRWRSGWIVRVAWLVTASVALALHALALPSLVRHISPDRAAALAAAGLTPAAYAGWLGFIGVLTALAFAAAGGLLIWYRPNERMAQFAAFVLLLFGSLTFTGQGTSPVGDYPILMWAYAVLDALGRAGFTVFVFVFPNGRFVPRWTCWLALAWITVQVPVPFAQVDFVKPVLPIVELLTSPLFLAGLVTAAAGQVYRYRRVSTAPQRLQTRWTAIGFAVALGVFVIANAVQMVLPAIREPLPNLVVQTTAFAAITLIPISIAVALLRHGLFDVDVLLGRALVYGALTASTVAVFMLVVGYLGSLFRTQDNLVISLLGTGAVAVMFQPLRERLQRGVNRLLYGQRDEPYVVLSNLGRRLDASVDRATILPVMVETVATALKLPYAAIQLERDGELVEVAAVGELRGPPVNLALAHHGQPMGNLVLGRRGRSEPLSTADRRLLDDLARQAAAALYAVRLNVDLQRSRERLVMAREEERRRLRRDLHDGLGPTLAALGLKVETARNRLGRDSAADGLLADLSVRTQGAVADIRRLVYGLRPPALDDLGLIGALQQLIGVSEPPPRIELAVRTEGLPPLSAAAEVAAYRIAQEAMTNVVRHAQATQCTIRLQLIDGALHLSVEDNGSGLPEVVHRGVGLASMRERAEELGGTFGIAGRPGGGTNVKVSLPLLEVEPVT